MKQFIPILIGPNPELVEDDYFKKADGAVISIPQRAPEGAILHR